MKDIVITMPAVALRGLTILPGMIAHFDISREKSMKAVEASMMDNQKVFLVTQKNVEQDNPELSDLFTVGIIAEIKQVIKLQNDVVRVLVEGQIRAEVSEFTEREEYLEAGIVTLETPEDELPDNVKEAMLGSIKESFAQYARLNGNMGQDVIKQVEGYADLEKLIDYISNNLPVGYADKQKILESFTLSERYEVLLSLLFREIDIISIQKDFQKKVKERVDKNQKEYILREQMALIREELGESTQSDAEGYLQAVEKLKASKEVKERIKKEIQRFRSINSNSSESAVSRGYIETLLELPWNKVSKDNTDIDHAQKVLDEDHYGMEKIKERMLEFLAVRNLTKKGDSPIICLVGPPGTGKTSFARSVARALDK